MQTYNWVIRDIWQTKVTGSLDPWVRVLCELSHSFPATPRGNKQRHPPESLPCVSGESSLGLPSHPSPSTISLHIGARCCFALGQGSTTPAHGHYQSAEAVGKHAPLTHNHLLQPPLVHKAGRVGDRCSRAVQGEKRE